MLHEAIRQHQRADGHILEASGHAHVDDARRVVQVDEQLRGHGRIHLSHAAAAGHHVLPDAVKGHARLHPFRLRALREQALDLARHGVQQSCQHKKDLTFLVFSIVNT